jgi:hypothetical protein
VNRARIFFVVSFGVVVAAACGGSNSSGNTAGGGDSGSSSGSSAGSSGDGGGSNPDDASGMPWYAVPCMAGTCDAGEVCCAAGGPFGDGGGRETATCQTGSCQMGSFQLCSSSNVSSVSDCPAPLICYGTNAGRICRTPPCTGSSCGSGQVCCNGAGAGAFTCQTGSCPTGSSQVCSSASDCPAPLTCMTMGAPFGFCRTPQCTAGSCGSGQVCCTAGPFGGAGGQCQMGTSCPRGTYMLCSSSADCPSGDLCAVVARDSDGGTTTYCFPGVADAGAGGG